MSQARPSNVPVQSSNSSRVWVNRAAFASPAAGTLGNLGRNVIVGPSFFSIDPSAFKEFPIKERFRLQFRAEMFNILNHPNFNSPGFGGNGVVAIANSLNYTSTNFGKIGSTRDAPYDPRQIQFALKFYY